MPDLLANTWYIAMMLYDDDEEIEKLIKFLE